MAQATLNVDVQAQTGSLETGMNRVNNSLDNTAKKADEAGKKGVSAFKALENAVQSAGGKLGAFQDNLAGGARNLLTSIPGIGSAFGAVFGVLDGVVGKFRELERTSKQLGTTLIQTQALKLWSRGMYDEATHGMSHFQQELGNASMGSEEAQRKLKGLGLDWAELSAKTPYEALKVVADKIRNTGDQSQRTAIAVSLFGRSGKDLVPMLAEGSAGLDAFNQRAEHMRSQLEAAQKASNWYKDVSAGFGVVGYKTTQAVQETGGFFSDITGMGGKGAFKDRWQSVEQGVGNWFKSSGGGEGQGFTPEEREAWNNLMKIGLGYLDQFAQKQAELNREQEKAKAQQLREQAVQGEISKQTEALEKQLQILSMGESAYQRMQLAQRGATEAQLEQLKGLQEMNEAYRKQQDLQKLAQHTIEDSMSPLERWEKKQADIVRLWEQGALTWDQFQKAINHLDEEMPQEHKLAGSAQSVGALQQGSVEASNAIIRAQQQQGADPQLQEIIRQLQNANQALQDAPVIRKGNV